MAKLSKRLCLYLSDTLASDIKLLSYLFKGARSAVLESETKFNYLLFSGSESVKYVAKLLTEQGIRCALGGRGRIHILDEVTKVAILLLTDRSLKRYRVLSYLHDISYLVSGDAELFCDLIGSRLSAKLL